MFLGDRHRLVAAARALAARGFDVELQSVDNSERVHRIQSEWLSDSHGLVRMVYSQPFLCPVITDLDVTASSTAHESRYIEMLLQVALDAARVTTRSLAFHCSGAGDLD